MIVVVEGISAAGKTTFCRRFGRRWVPEFPAQGQVPGLSDPAGVHAAYWVEHNVRRFQAALEVEAEHGFAICDTEPWKSHFDWSMARAGFKTMEVFDAAIPIARKAISEQRLGFGGRYYVKRIPPLVARAQKEADSTRSRRNFEMHLALQPHLLDWFNALSDVLPGRVSFSFPKYETLLAELTNHQARDSESRRFEVSVLDALLERLPN
jgi:hypothetical protein